MYKKESSRFSSNLQRLDSKFSCQSPRKTSPDSAFRELIPTFGFRKDHLRNVADAAALLEVDDFSTVACTTCPAALVTTSTKALRGK